MQACPRPLFLLAVLLLAFGFQTLALGLLGEIISFSHASRSKPYRIRELVRRQPDGEPEKERVRAEPR